MIPVVVTRKPGEPSLDVFTVDEFADQHFHTDERIRETWGTVGMYQRAVVNLFIVPNHRAEGFLYTETGKPVAMAMYARVTDIHYGMMAQPIMIFIDPEYRGDLKVTRAVSQLVKNVVRQLDVPWYNVPKHPAQDVQQFHTRRI